MGTVAELVDGRRDCAASFNMLSRRPSRPLLDANSSLPSTPSAVRSLQRAAVVSTNASDSGAQSALCTESQAPAHVVAIVGSAGCLEPLITIVSALPRDLDAAVLVVVHYPQDFESVLPRVLARRASIPVSHARDGEVLSSGRVYVAPSGRCHVSVDAIMIHVRPGAAVHGHTPAGDPLLQSLARSFGSRAIGVVLSGADRDGAAGLREIEAAGGTTLVQAPADAELGCMPLAALAATRVDLCAPAQEIALRLVELCRRSRPS